MAIKQTSIPITIIPIPIMKTLLLENNAIKHN